MLGMLDPIQSVLERAWALQHAEFPMVQALLRKNQLVTDLEEDSARKDKLVEGLEQALTRLNAEDQSLIMDGQESRYRIEQLLNSTSCRITAPFRAIKSFFL